MGSQPNFDSDSSIPLDSSHFDHSPEAIGPFEDPAAVPPGNHGPVAPSRSRKPGRRWPYYVIAGALVLIGLVVYEAKTSYLQSRWLPDIAGRMQYQLEAGPTDQVRYPRQGPFDRRLGYTRLPLVLNKLQANGFLIEQQARMSPEMLDFANSTLYVPYREKSQAGLKVIDSEQRAMYDFRYPRRVFSAFEDIPPLMVEALLFIEDRRLLDGDKPRLNPAVNWGRFLKAILFKVGDVINIDTPSMGGSTLATQIEKFRHSENGITSSAEEKLRQMMSASVRVYQWGPDTMAARRLLVLDYLNTVPLSAAPGYGEVNGIGDGLHVWFGTDVDEVNRLLQLQDAKGTDLDQQGLALRRIMALMIAHRRPSYYLGQNREDLAELVDSHLRLLGRKGVISLQLMQAALAQPLRFRNFAQNPAVVPVEVNKGTNMVRNRVSRLLEVSLYDLDRIDLTAYRRRGDVYTARRDRSDPLTSGRNLPKGRASATTGLVSDPCRATRSPMHTGPTRSPTRVPR